MEIDTLGMTFVIGKTGLIAHKNTPTGNLMICVPYSDIDNIHEDYGSVFIYVRGKIHVSSDVSSDYRNLQFALCKFYDVNN